MQNRLEEKWIKFHFRSAFPASSILSHWISGLTMASNDLNQAHKDYREKANSSGNQPSPEALFYFGLACAQYRETAKFLCKGGQSIKVQEFNKTLPVETINQWEELKKSYEPWKGSFVESVAKPVRDLFFHYPEPTSPKWKSALENLASEESGVCLKNEMRVGDFRGIFADDLRAYFISTCLGTGKDKVNDSVTQVAHLTNTLVNFAQQSLGTYLQKLPKGVTRVDNSSSC